MKNYGFARFFLFFCCLPFLNIFAVNDLVIKLPNSYSSGKGYIDKATLVIEPHGSYSEQSLYLNYSDHGQFSSGTNVEIIHRFELPQGAVVNDMWLWIGDSVMQAKIFDTWTARHIYDSVTTTRRDPAFLSKIGNQYELRIFPLPSGKFRKIKLNYIVPTKWNGNTATIEFPIAMLNSNNNIQKPLEILFRTKQNVWGNPVIMESTNQAFVNKVDTLGFNYKYTLIPSTSQFSSLNLSYKLDVSSGAYFGSSSGKDNQIYFQSIFSLKDAFNLTSDSSAKKYIVALDLSGNFNKNFTDLTSKLKTLLNNSLKPNDQFKIIVSGAGKVKKLSSKWLPADLQTIMSTIDNFTTSSFGDSVRQVFLPRVICADGKSYNNLGYDGITSIAAFSFFDNLAASYSHIGNADAVSYYNDLPDNSTLQLVYTQMDSLFARGGQFYSRSGFSGTLPSHYIKNLGAKFNSHNAVTLYRNLNGNIGACFPEQFVYSIDSYFITSDDPDVKTELADKDGNPVVISKRIGKGLLVVSGISSAQDDISLKKMFSSGFLGLNRTRKPSGLPALISTLANEFSAEHYDKVLLISNSDSLISTAGARNFVFDYFKKFSSKPVFNSINLLNGDNPVFPIVTDNFIDYVGSGFMLRALSEATSGLNFETHLQDWNFINQSLSPFSISNPEQLFVEVSADNSQSNITDMVQIKQTAEMANTPRCFIGSSLPATEIKCKVTAKFPGIDSLKIRYFTFPVSNNSQARDTIIPAMLGYEKIKSIFSSQAVDTAKIVQLAMKYNLLCDYTALLALEPNQNNHFMINPFDESRLTKVEKEQFADSLQMSVFPNPFNSQTRIVVSLRNPAKVSLKVYNVLGKVVREITDNEDVARGKVYMWDGKNDANASVSSGIYFVMLQVRENDSNRNFVQSRKLLLIK